MWRSYHVYYHSGRRRLVRELVRPLVSTLVRDRQIDRFFFIYYPLGGPHVRLRLRLDPAAVSAVDRLVADAAAEFFSRSPSLSSLDPATILQHNKRIIAGAPIEHDSEVYPDNSLQVFPYDAETERYGGPALIAHSLDFFTLSSAHVLLLNGELGDLSRGSQLSGAFRLLVRQAWGFAGTTEELLRLLRYRPDSWSTEEKPAILQGDRVFGSRPESFVGLLRSELESLAGRLPAGEPRAAGPLLLAEGSRRLSAEIRTADADSRRRIGVSQMHMTANRLALIPDEETYLCRLMSRAAQRLVATEAARWSELSRFLGRARSGGASDRLGDLLQPMLAAISGASSPPSPMSVEAGGPGPLQPVQ